jgi:hypothetical protein
VKVALDRSDSSDELVRAGSVVDDGVSTEVSTTSSVAAVVVVVAAVSLDDVFFMITVVVCVWVTTTSLTAEYAWAQASASGT